METKFYICDSCNNILMTIGNKPADGVCSKQDMKELIPGKTDGAVEKHVPSVKVEGKNVIVTVGEVEHPMEDEHFIEWIFIETKEGSQIKKLKPGEKPNAVFALSDTDEFVAAYAYCGLHGLWSYGKD